MKSWEVDVELRMRKTLAMAGPVDEGAVRAIVDGAMKHGGVGLEMFQKVEISATGRAVPVEEIVDNAPTIVAVREVEE